VAVVIYHRRLFPSELTPLSETDVDGLAAAEVEQFLAADTVV